MEYLTDDNYIDILRNVKNVAIFIKFSASWCGPCMRIAPHFEQLMNINRDAHFYKVDVDSSPQISNYFKVRALPTIIAIRNGIEMEKVEGANIDAINQLIAKYK